MYSMEDICTLWRRYVVYGGDMYSMEEICTLWMTYSVWRRYVLYGGDKCSMEEIFCMEEIMRNSFNTFVAILPNGNGENEIIPRKKIGSMHRL